MSTTTTNGFELREQILRFLEILDPSDFDFGASQGSAQELASVVVISDE
ncbi:MAG: hypothetical protein QM784_28520 [Polyangiaceae bacterium]